MDYTSSYDEHLNRKKIQAHIWLRFTVGEHRFLGIVILTIFLANIILTIGITSPEHKGLVDINFCMGT